jgi:hypothetical protein
MSNLLLYSEGFRIQKLLGLETRESCAIAGIAEIKNFKLRQELK